MNECWDTPIFGGWKEEVSQQRRLRRSGRWDRRKTGSVLETKRRKCFNKQEVLMSDTD